MAGFQNRTNRRQQTRPRGSFPALPPETINLKTETMTADFMENTDYQSLAGKEDLIPRRKRTGPATRSSSVVSPRFKAILKRMECVRAGSSRGGGQSYVTSRTREDGYAACSEPFR